MCGLKDTEQWRMGRWTEEAVSRFYQQHGWWVVETNLIERGGAPALIQQMNRYILPDHQRFRNGRGRWMEIKSKREPVKWQKGGGELRHGIYRQCWDDYLLVIQETGIPGDLVILQRLPEPMLLIQNMKRLEPIPHAGSWESFGDREMVFFRFDNFNRFTVSDDLTIPDNLLIARKASHPWDGLPQINTTRQPSLFED